MQIIIHRECDTAEFPVLLDPIETCSVKKWWETKGELKNTHFLHINRQHASSQSKKFFHHLVLIQVELGFEDGPL